jgi:hypothetical protein
MPGAPPSYQPYGYAAPPTYPSPAPYPPQFAYAPTQQPSLTNRVSWPAVAVVAIVALALLAALAGGAALYLARSGTTGHASAPTATALTTPTATLPSGVVYSSTLTGNVTDWPNGGGCTPESDGYHITAGVACYPNLADQSDVTLTVTVMQLSGDQSQTYGVSFRRVSQSNRYFFDIDSNGEWGFGKSVNGTDTFIIDATTNAAIQTGQNASNTLQVQASGSHFTFFVNGTQVGQGDDSTYASGKWGLEGSNNIEVVFTNITITNTPQCC